MYYAKMDNIDTIRKLNVFNRPCFIKWFANVCIVVCLTMNMNLNNRTELNKYTEIDH